MGRARGARVTGTRVRHRWAGHRGSQMMDTGSARRWIWHLGARVMDTGVRHRWAGHGGARVMDTGGQRSLRCQQPGVPRPGKELGSAACTPGGVGRQVRPCFLASTASLRPPYPATHTGGGSPRPRSPGSAGSQRAACPWTLGAASAGTRDEAPERSRRGQDPSLPLSSGHRCEGSTDLWFPPKEKALLRERRRRASGCSLGS